MNMNFLDICLIIILILAFAGAVFIWVSNHRRGGGCSGCGGGCSGCGMSGSCGRRDVYREDAGSIPDKRGAKQRRYHAGEERG